MTSLAAVNSVDIQILVDNVTDSLSSVPSFVETELGGLGRRRGGAWVLGGNCLCCAAHGLSCLLTVRRRRQRAYRPFRHRTGGSHLRAECLAARHRSGPVEAIVLCHGHWDHAGAMLRALQLVRDRNGGKRRRLLHASRHVPQPRRQDAGRLLPADGGRALAGGLDGPGRPRRLHARGAGIADDMRLRQRRDPAAHAASRPACPASIAAPLTARAGSPTNC